MCYHMISNNICVNKCKIFDCNLLLNEEMADFDDKIRDDNDLFDDAGKEILKKLGVDPEGIAGMQK